MTETSERVGWSLFNVHKLTEIVSFEATSSCPHSLLTFSSKEFFTTISFELLFGDPSCRPPPDQRLPVRPPLDMHTAQCTALNGSEEGL